MSYVDGFVLSLPKDKLEEYCKIAKEAGKVWMDHGALEYRESIMDDDNIEGTRSFKDAAGTKEGEVAIFSYILYKSREHRDEVNKKAMADPRLSGFSPEKMPFDCKRMAYGGFKTILEF